MKTLFVLSFVLAAGGLSACKQQAAEAPTPVAQEQAAPAAPAAGEQQTEAGNPAEAAGTAATPAPTAPATK